MGILPQFRDIKDTFERDILFTLFIYVSEVICSLLEMVGL